MMKNKQDKYTKSARGQMCQIRIPGICQPAPENETTVLAHLNGAGIAMKHLPIHAAYACAACHDAIDGRSTTINHDDALAYHLAGMVRTQILMVKNGVLIL